MSRQGEAAPPESWPPGRLQVSAGVRHLHSQPRSQGGGAGGPVEHGVRGRTLKAESFCQGRFSCFQSLCFLQVQAQGQEDVWRVHDDCVRLSGPVRQVQSLTGAGRLRSDSLQHDGDCAGAELSQGRTLWQQQSVQRDKRWGMWLF